MLTIFPENAKLGLPSIDGLMILNDPTTGKTEAILDGQAVTAYRTGAVGGVAVRHLSRKDCHSVGIAGAGTQAFYQTLYACAARDIREVNIYNHSDRDLTEFIRKLTEAIDSPNTKVIWRKTSREMCENSDIIITTTPSTEPMLPNDKELLRGKCIIGIGSYTPEMREIPDAVLELVDRVYTEMPYACEESGDLSQPIAQGKLSMDRVVYMSDYLAEGKDIEITKDTTTYFKSVGMGLYDVWASKKLVEDAVKQGIGQNVNI
jgi:ornithine cyclodeaminase/alanine dehydrogenase-like protein (mu-crystallin family)